MSIQEIQAVLHQYRDAARARNLQRYFKTGPGEYAEGDTFLGIRVPDTRRVAKHFKDVNVQQITELLGSSYHEERLMGVFVLVDQYQKADRKQQKTLYKLYMAHLDGINNWDLVDSSAGKIVGAYLYDKDRTPLDRLKRSKNLWRRRIAIMATGHFIAHGDYVDTLRIAEDLLLDKHDLIHKAVGWMLREIGKRDRPCMEAFLARHYRAMPRAMLRYAIEKLPKSRRQQYLQDKA